MKELFDLFWQTPLPSQDIYWIQPLRLDGQDERVMVGPPIGPYRVLIGPPIEPYMILHYVERDAVPRDFRIKNE